jgi:hypothetical protein
MKTFVILTVLFAVATWAGDAVSIGPEPPSDYNAKWNLFRAGEVRCDRAGLNEYGSNDDAMLYYTGLPINLAGYDGVRMRIVYMQDAADDGDYCQLYLGDEIPNYTLFHTFANTDGMHSVSLMLDGYYGVRDLHIRFVWVSDETGVAKGFRVYDIEITGIAWSDGDCTNIFTWDSSEDVTGHQTVGVDWMLLHENMNCFAFIYGNEGDTPGWWAVDNVEILADGESVMPLQGGGYGVEDFSSGSWFQDRHGLPGGWESDTDHAADGMTGENWQCDSAAHPGWGYEAETFTPWVDIGGDKEVGVEFDTWYHPGGADESASLVCYGSCPDERTLYYEDFGNLDDWGKYDDGSNVTGTSWGAIKAGF